MKMYIFPAREIKDRDGRTGSYQYFVQVCDKCIYACNFYL